MADNSIKEPSSEPGQVEYSLNELADVLDYRRQSLSEILKASGAKYKVGPRGSHLYTLPEVFKSIILWDKTASAGQESKNTGDQDKARLTAAKASLAELELQKKQGQLVDTSLVLGAVSSEYAAVRSQLLTIPQSMAIELSVTNNPEACQKLLEDKITTILMALQFDSQRQIEELESEPFQEIEEEQENEELP